MNETVKKPKTKRRCVRRMRKRHLDVLLSWPYASLSPNHGGSWKAKESARVKAVREGYYACKKAWPFCDVRVFKPQGLIRVSYFVFPPNRARRDDDNVIASLKHYQDGIASALGVDDRHFNIVGLHRRSPDPHHKGLIVFRLEWLQ